MKLISFAVPCYNSESYMKRCIDSLLIGGNKVEIIIVNDGSSDRTGEIADRYKEEYPDIIKVIHKENGGHGSGIMAGLSVAEGLYYKIVDSDDWADPDAYHRILQIIEESIDAQDPLDMIICNYVYEHDERKNHTVHYHGILPRHRKFTWSECRAYDITRYIIMHSAFYRTELVRKAELNIPLHTFYVDNIFLYYTLPYVKTLYYSDADFYRYYIGREDQSVNEKNMIKRVDQQILVSKLILKRHDLTEIRKIEPRLYRCMINYASIMVLIASSLLTIDGTKDSIDKLAEYWEYIKREHPQYYKHLRYRSLAGVYSHKNKVVRTFSVIAYRIVQKLYKFN